MAEEADQSEGQQQKPRLMAYESRTLHRGDWDLTPQQRAQAIYERQQQEREEGKE